MRIATSSCCRLIELEFTLYMQSQGFIFPFAPQPHHSPEAEMRIFALLNNTNNDTAQSMRCHAGPHLYRLAVRSGSTKMNPCYTLHDTSTVAWSKKNRISSLPVFFKFVYTNGEVFSIFSILTIFLVFVRGSHLRFTSY